MRVVAPAKPEIQSQTLEQLQSYFRDWNEPSYRIKQLLDWVHKHRISQWSQMTNLPAALREKLAQTFQFHPLELVTKQGSHDTTQKFLWRLQDHSLVESVLIPANPALYGEPSDRHTLCVSTQVGCAYGCRFCASGLEGWKRNLTAAEIIEQVLAVERAMKGVIEKEGDRIVNNLVIMGMGEPLANYDSLMEALRILNAPWGGNIGARKITISTSGLVPQIKKLADDPLQFRLAISLHGATDEIRNKIMPVNKKFPVQQLADACEYYQQKKGRMITLEYILIAGVNDAPPLAQPLARLAHRLHAKVNLIPYNKVDGLPWERPSDQAQEHFYQALSDLKVTTTLRREKGHDIDAACGQLRLKTEKG